MEIHLVESEIHGGNVLVRFLTPHLSVGLFITLPNKGFSPNDLTPLKIIQMAFEKSNNRFLKMS